MEEKEEAARATGSTATATIKHCSLPHLLITVRLTCDLDAHGCLCLQANFINEHSRDALIIISFNSR